MRVPCYIRVSSEKQKKQWSLTTQEKQARSFYLTQGWTWDKGLLYWDDESGAKSDRGGFLEYCREIETRHYTIACIANVDRLGRDAVENMLFKRRLKDMGIKIRSIAQPGLDFDSPSGELLFNMQSVIAQHERSQLIQRVRENKATRAEAGLTNGSVIPYGYRQIKPRLVVIDGKPRKVTFAPDPKTARVVRWIFQTYATGRTSLVEMASTLNARGLRTGLGNPFGSTSVSFILRNKLYAGYVKYLGRDYKGAHEPLISLALWEKAQARRSERARKGRGVHPKALRTYIFGNSLTVCAHCNHPIRWSTWKDRHQQSHINGRCNSHDRGMPCPSSGHYMSEAMVETAIVEEIARWKLDDHAVQQALAAIRLPEEKSVNRQIAALEARRERKRLTFEAGAIAHARWKEEDEALAAQLRELRGKLANPITTDVLKRAEQLLHDLPVLWEKMTREEKCQVTHEVFERIVLNCDTKEVVSITMREEYRLLLKV